MMSPDIDNDPAYYNLTVLRMMFNALPEDVNIMLSQQLDKFLDCITSRELNFTKAIENDINDVQLLVSAMSFDLEATRRERDRFKNKDR